MQVLFIVNNEVTRRAINPVLDVFIKNGTNCKILETEFCNQCMSLYASRFIDLPSARSATWDFIISANRINAGEFNGRRAVMHHGSMFGNSAWSLESAYLSDIYFLMSPHELPYVKHHLKEKFVPEKFIVAGNPANDHFVKYTDTNSNFRSEVRARLGLSEKKTILLSSHWTSSGNLRRFGTGLLDAVASNFPDYQVICTCHPKLLTSPKSEIQMTKTIETPHFNARWLMDSLEAKRSENIKILIEGVESSDLLFASDIFVGDHSSLLAEAAYFNMPLIANMEGSYFDKTVSKIVSSDICKFKNIEELMGVLEYIDRNGVASVNTGRNIRKLFMHNVGFAAKNIFDSLTSMR